MVFGTTKILLSITMSDEFGVYRITESGARYLLLSFDVQQEAEECGKMIASFLHIKLENRFPATTLKGFNLVNVAVEKSLVQEKPKIKKVRGISQLCQELLYKNTPEEEILRIITEKYLAAGRDETYAKESAAWYLREALS